MSKTTSRGAYGLVAAAALLCAPSAFCADPVRGASPAVPGDITSDATFVDAACVAEKTPWGCFVFLDGRWNGAHYLDSLREAVSPSAMLASCPLPRHEECAARLVERSVYDLAAVRAALEVSK